MDQQSNHSGTHDLKKIAGILIRAAIISIVLLIVWFGWLLMASEFAYNIYSIWFGITQRDFILLNIFGLLVFKIFCTVFFLIPFAAIKLYEKPKQSKTKAIL